MKPEKPDFFLRTPAALGSLLSSECLLEAIREVSGTLAPWDFSFTRVSAAEKLADWRSAGGPIVLASGEVCDGGGGGECWMESCWGGDCWMGDFVSSMRLRMAVPSKGAPISSADVLEPRG
jgi:hypothetical protein